MRCFFLPVPAIPLHYLTFNQQKTLLHDLLHCFIGNSNKLDSYPSLLGWRVDTYKLTLIVVARTNYTTKQDIHKTDHYICDGMCVGEEILERKWMGKQLDSPLSLPRRLAFHLQLYRKLMNTSHHPDHKHLCMPSITPTTHCLMDVTVIVSSLPLVHQTSPVQRWHTTDCLYRCPAIGRHTWEATVTMAWTNDKYHLRHEHWSNSILTLISFLFFIILFIFIGM